MSEVIAVDLITTEAEVVLLAEPVVIELATATADVMITPPPAVDVVLDASATGVQVLSPPAANIQLVNETSTVTLEPELTSVTVAPIGTQGPPGPSVTGPQGEQGPVGPQGPSGPPGDGSYLEFNFATPSTEWVLPHNLNSYGVVVITVDNADNEIEGDVDYVSANTVVVRWYYPFAGKARVFT